MKKECLKKTYEIRVEFHDNKGFLKKTCPICGKFHDDKGYGKACKSCWLTWC